MFIRIMTSVCFGAAGLVMVFGLCRSITAYIFASLTTDQKRYGMDRLLLRGVDRIDGKMCIQSGGTLKNCFSKLVGVVFLVYHDRHDGVSRRNLDVLVYIGGD